MSNYSKKPILTANDEEYTMLIEVSDEFEKQKIDKTTREKSGNATKIVIRNHLLRLWDKSRAMSLVIKLIACQARYVFFGV